MHTGGERQGKDCRQKRRRRQRRRRRRETRSDKQQTSPRHQGRQTRGHDRRQLRRKLWQRGLSAFLRRFHMATQIRQWPSPPPLSFTLFFFKSPVYAIRPPPLSFFLHSFFHSFFFFCLFCNDLVVSCWPPFFSTTKTKTKNKKQKGDWGQFDGATTEHKDQDQASRVLEERKSDLSRQARSR